jgi:hypothetical protein
MQQQPQITPKGIAETKRIIARRKQLDARRQGSNITSAEGRRLARLAYAGGQGLTEAETRPSWRWIALLRTSS